MKGASPLSSNWVGKLVESKFACVLCQRVIVVARILERVTVHAGGGGRLPRAVTACGHKVHACGGAVTARVR